MAAVREHVLVPLVSDLEFGEHLHQDLDGVVIQLKRDRFSGQLRDQMVRVLVIPARISSVPESRKINAYSFSPLKKEMLACERVA